MSLIPRIGERIGEYIVTDHWLVDPSRFSILFKVVRAGVGGAECVMKMLNPLYRCSDKKGEILDDFLREIDTLTSVGGHPTIVSVVGVVRDPGNERYAYIMPYLEGPTLEQFAHGVLSKTGNVSGIAENIPYQYLRAILLIGSVLADALTYLHGRGVIHRDVKPTNVIMQPDGPVLIDFDCVSVSSRAVTHRVNHRIPGRVGTWGYMSPEAFRGEITSPVADTFNLGATMRACLTGLDPYSDEVLLAMPTGEQVWSEHERRHEEPVLPVRSIPGMPDALRMLLDGATHQYAFARPTMIQFRDGLKMILDQV
ncbi:protein kinase [Patescibacteria group bacterium]|nr:protein kinase [Patescibacteria group bacterium]